MKPLSFLASSSVESHARHSLAGLKSGLVILCFRVPNEVSVMNVFRGLCKDRLAFIKASCFFPRWAAVCLLLVGIFLAELVLSVLLIMIITANVD